MKTKRHLLLLLKKKSTQITEAEVKELSEIEKACAEDDKKKEDEAKAKAAADDAAKAEADKKAKEEADKAAAEEAAKKKPAEEQKADPAASGAVTIEELSSKIDAISQNLQMVMEALANMLGEEETEESGEAEPKEGEAATDEQKAEVVQDPNKKPKEEEDMSEEEMQKALEDVIAEMEQLEAN
jgi:hypothetical protein